MATFTATAASTNVSPRVIHSGLYSITGGPFSFTPSVGDVVQMLKVPLGFSVKELLLHASARPLSSGGTIQTILTVGDDIDTDRYMSASVSTTGVVRLGSGVVSGFPYTYTANNTIDVTIGASSGSDSASQTVTLTLIATGSVDD